MDLREILPDKTKLAIENIRFHDSKKSVELTVRSTAQFGDCPDCGCSSTRIHSHYGRRLTDLPWQGLQVEYIWQARKFFCGNLDCSRKIFTERLPEFAQPHARRSVRLNVAIQCIAIACGGQCGSRLSARLGILISPDTLLREVRRRPSEPRQSPRVIGIDDWAFRKGQRYGTVIIDLERRRAIDLLPDRDSDLVKRWLEDHPSVEIISRDRGDCFIKGASEGAPNAVQVADRFHLFQNLREAFERLLSRHSKHIQEASEQLFGQIQESEPAEPNVTSESQEEMKPARTPSAASNRRRKLYDTVMALHEKGTSAREIARSLSIHRKTVRNFIQSNHFPDRATRQYSRQTDLCLDFLKRRWAEGCHNAKQLRQEVHDRGFTASYHSIRRRVAKWRSQNSSNGDGNTARRQRASPKRLSWLLFKNDNDLADDDRSLKEKLFILCPEITKGWKAASEFLSLFKKRIGATIARWIDCTTEEGQPRELRSFAQGIRRDLEAVTAAVTLQWSNGQTEGQVNRLKMLKRQMYGRAGFDLLRLRYLAAT